MIILPLLLCASTPSAVIARSDVVPTTPYLQYWPAAAFALRAEWARTTVDWRVSLNDNDCSTTVDLVIRTDVYLSDWWLWPRTGSYDASVLKIVEAPKGCRVDDVSISCVENHIYAYEGEEANAPVYVTPHEIKRTLKLHTRRLEMGELALPAPVRINDSALDYNPGVSDVDHPTGIQTAPSGIVQMPVPAPKIARQRRVQTKIKLRDFIDENEELRAYNARLAACVPRP